MPLERKKVPLDPPAVIAVRERLKPADATVVVAKDGEGRLVECLHDGSLVPWTERIEKAILDSLVRGTANRYRFRWINQHRRRMAEARGAGRWEPVRASDNEVWCPYAYGETTDGLVHNADTILCKRDTRHAEQLRRDRLYYDNPERILELDAEATKETLMSMGAKDVETTFEMDTEHPVTITLDAD